MLSIGDRVTRLMFDNTILHGVIVDKYGSKPNHLGFSNILYTIKWDGETENSRYYMEIGLRKEIEESQKNNI